ncbi:MAG: ECF-type sigma factor [Pseudomonadota bacterium]
MADDITRLLSDWRSGQESALEQLTPQVYDELKRIAARMFRGENAGHTLQPTAVVNEAFLNLVDANVDYQNRAHFFSLAARMMRRILVDHAKAKSAAKRGGSERNEHYTEGVAAANPAPDREILALDAALDELAALDERRARVLELHYFGGLSYEEMSEVLGVASATLSRDLRAARAWLKSQMSA